MSDTLKESQGDDLLSFDEALKFLDTSKSTLYRLLSQDEVKGVKVGKQWRFRRADLTAYVERGPVAVSVDGVARLDLDEALSTLTEMHQAETDASPEAKLGALAEGILALAFESGASDIHLEPAEDALLIRFRIDGVLHETRRFPTSLHDLIVTKFKEMADMNLLEKRLPQDGRIQIHLDEQNYDIRMSILPTLRGESAAMRLIDRRKTLLGLDRLGLEERQINLVRASIHRPNGMILCTGPTNSGKTTFLYSGLLEIDPAGAKVLTVEDPVESLLAGVTQIQVNRRLGLTYAAGIRSVLRHDPDVIMCGELPDQETVQACLQAASTGQIVFSALHAEDCLGALVRLVDIGIERFLINSSLNVIVATRRIRKLCNNCREVLDQKEAATLLAKIKPLAARGGLRIAHDTTFYRPIGCEKCRRTGFQGRMNLYEILACNPKLVSRLLQCESTEEMERIAVDSGMRTLLAEGVSKAIEGKTSLQEVLRVTNVGE